jgi:hypothetical protein
MDTQDGGRTQQMAALTEVEIELTHGSTVQIKEKIDSFN